MTFQKFEPKLNLQIFVVERQLRFWKKYSVIIFSYLAEYQTFIIDLPLWAIDGANIIGCVGPG